MPQLQIGDQMQLDGKQMAVITGMPANKLEPGHVFSWGPGRFKLASVGPDQSCVIVRLAAGEGERGTEPGIQHQQEEKLNPRSVQRSPAYLPGAGVDTGIPPVQPPMTHDQVFPREGPGREIVEKVDVLGPELKQPHTHWLRSPQINEPEDTGRKLSSEQVLYKMFGFKDR
jgi:hypothetical protein